MQFSSNYQYNPLRPDRHHGFADRKAKRQKIQVACQECRDRKIRCDGSKPICDSCFRKNLPVDRCVYFHTNPASIPYVKRLEERIQELESSHGSSTASSLGQRNVIAPLSHPPESKSIGYPDGPWSNPILSPQTRSLERISPSNPERNNTTAQFDNSSPNPVESSLVISTSDRREAQSDGSPTYLGSSSAVGFMAEVYQTFASKTHAASKNREGSASTSSRLDPTSWLASSRSEPADFVSLASEFMIPPRYLSDRLVESYWIGAHPLQPIIHRRAFMKHYNRLWSKNDPDDSAGSPDANIARGGDRLFHCTLNIILMLGCKFWSVSDPHDFAVPAGSEQHFLRQADKLLNLDLLDDPSIELVQALLLRVQSQQNLGLSNKAWVLTGMAIRVAQAIGLQLDADGESQERREERRKTWSTCVLLDRVQSMTFGRPLMLDSAVKFSVPQVIDEEYLSVDPTTPDATQPPNVPARIAWYINVLKLSNITAEILCLSYYPIFDQTTGDRRFSDYDSLFKVDSELEKWHDELPEFLQYDKIALTPNAQDLFVRQGYLLHHRYLHSKILLFRRVVVRLAAKSLANSSPSSLSSVERSIAMSCIEVCTSAVQSLLETIFPHIGTKLIPPSWHTILVIYTAGTVLAVIFLTPSFCESLLPEQLRRLHRSWTRCIDCLEEYQKQGMPTALPCLQNLRSLYRARSPDIVESHGPEKAADETRADLSAQPRQDRATQAEYNQLMEPQLLAQATSDPYSIVTPNVWWPEDLFDSFIDLALPGG